MTLRSSIALAAALRGIAALGMGCGAAPTVGEAPRDVALPADPAQFDPDRFDANLSELTALGSRRPGSEAIEAARAWARVNAGEAPGTGAIVLAAPLVTGEVEGGALAAESSALALMVEVARALAAGGAAARVALIAGDAGDPEPALQGAPLVVFVKRACGVPERRDLLSHRVLRERFFTIAGVEAVSFEQSDAPHAALLSAGARRVVALDAPPREGEPCHPERFGNALVRFVREASNLLSRGRVNSVPAFASHPGS